MRAAPPLLRLLVALLAAASLSRSAGAAPLPPYQRWLEGALPPAAVGPALKAFYQRLPDDLCSLGPAGISGLPAKALDELCPLKTAARLSRVLPGLRGIADNATIDKLAGAPVTVGGALVLLASDSAGEAAAIQKDLCQTLLYPQAKCRFSNATGTDPPGPLRHHLDTRDGALAAGKWLVDTVVPIALRPLGPGLARVPDALCKVPVKSRLEMLPSIKFQLCPYDVDIFGVLSLMSLGRAKSGELSIKLCDLTRRPVEACQGGRYMMDNATAVRIVGFQRASSQQAVYSWEPKAAPTAAKLPQLQVPHISITASPIDYLEGLASRWSNDTVPALRRYALSMFVPATLHEHVAAFLERLPSSICSATASGQALPAGFKGGVCPLGHTNGTATHSWAYALAEISMGAANASSAQAGAAAKSRLKAWLIQTCSAIYAPDLACNSSSSASANSTKATSQRAAGAPQASVSLLVQRTLRALPHMQRQQLVDGVAKRLDAWATAVGRLPKSVTDRMLGEVCRPVVNGMHPSGLAGPAPAAASDTLCARAVVAAIVGDSRVTAAVAKACLAV